MFSGTSAYPYFHVQGILSSFLNSNHDYTQTLIVSFHNNYIYTFFYRNTLFKLFTPLECKYNKLKFGVRISSIEVSKQELCISTSCMSTTKLQKGNPSQSDSFLKSEEIWFFPVSIGVCAALPRRRASRNSSKGWKRRFLAELRCV